MVGRDSLRPRSQRVNYALASAANAARLPDDRYVISVSLSVSVRLTRLNASSSSDGYETTSSEPEDPVDNEINLETEDEDDHETEVSAPRSFADDYEVPDSEGTESTNELVIDPEEPASTASRKRSRSIASINKGDVQSERGTKASTLRNRVTTKDMFYRVADIMDGGRRFEELEGPSEVYTA
ncbi:hypothetical protein MMC34_001548 [Xylographa carneopallida]|nr:hypothetical protein [Xylographa carneopallida]